MTETEESAGDITGMFARYIREVPGGLALAPYGTLRFACFIDLLSASHNPKDLSLMADSLSRWVREPCSRAGVKTIVTPKRGNTMLGFEVARRLALSSAFIREEVIFGRWIEGAINKTAKVAIVDDVSSDGSLLRDAVRSLRREGVYVDEVFVLVERTDGDARGVLADEGISLQFMISHDDTTLEQLLAERQKGNL